MRQSLLHLCYVLRWLHSWHTCRDFVDKADYKTTVWLFVHFLNPGLILMDG